MDNAAEVLLIIVSSVLSIFLVVLIIAGIYFIKVLKEVDRLATKAEYAVDRVESAAVAVGRTMSPIAAYKLIRGILLPESNNRRKKH
jgi:hypothetical protein